MDNILGAESWTIWETNMNALLEQYTTFVSGVQNDYLPGIKEGDAYKQILAMQEKVDRLSVRFEQLTAAA